MKEIQIFFLILFFAVVKSIFAQNWQIEPHEYLIIAFEDSTGAKDTVIVGFYNDPNFETAGAIVSLGVDSVFGEVNMPEEVNDSIFFARVERRFGDMVPYDTILYETFLKTDIRYNNETCQFYTGATDADFKVRFYNYKLPIVFEIQVFQKHEYSEVDYLGCFCENPIERTWCWDFQCKRSNEYCCDPLFKLSDTISCLEMDHFGIDIYRFETWGIDDKMNSSEVHIYPIPVQNLLSINSEIQIEGVQIFDVLGRSVYNVSKRTISSIDVSKYNKGIYIIKLKTYNNRIVTSKFVKQ